MEQPILKLDMMVNDILDLILDHLSLRDLSSLSKCSKLLNYRMEPTMFRGQSRKELAVGWACLNADLDLLRRAVSWKASVTVPMYYYMRDHPSLLDPPRYFPLHLATETGDPAIFELLIKLGATLDFAVENGEYQDADEEAEQITRDVENLLENLCQKENVEQLKVFVHSGLVSTPPAMNDLLHIDNCLLRVMDAIEASIDTVRFLLDNGADPKRLQRLHDYDLPCPLTLAIMNNRLDMAELLHERGANANGKEVLENDDATPRWHSYTPIFAAAHQMHDYGVVYAQKCIEWGADPCQRQPLQGPRHSMARPTPLHVYLDFATAELNDDNTLELTRGIQFWIDQGVPVRDPDHVPGTPFQADRSVFWFLMAKWGIYYLVHNDYYQALKLIAQQGMTAEESAWLRDSFYCLVTRGTATNRWKRLLTEFVEKE